MTRNKLTALGIAAVALGLNAAPALAEYPEKPVKIELGFPAGGGADIIARWYASKLEEKSKGTFIVDNKVGASGILSLDAAAKAKPDGYTLLFASTGTTAGNAYVFKNLPLDIRKDLVPVISFCETPFALSVNPQSPINTIAELTAFLKSKDGKATHGWATTLALAATVIYTAAAGVEVTPVGYKATSSAISDLTAGQIDFAFADIVFATGQAKQGRIKLLGVTSDQRAPGLPDLPTMKEAGVPLGDITPLWGVWVPSGTPKDVTDKLAKWVTEINGTKETHDFLIAQGATPALYDQAVYQQKFEIAMKAWEKATTLAKIEPQ